jgi:hypothetical protein
MAVATACKCLIALKRMVVSLIFASWNQLEGWLSQLQGLKEPLPASLNTTDTYRRWWQN